jgi:hypothetical protein
LSSPTLLSEDLMPSSQTSRQSSSPGLETLIAKQTRKRDSPPTSDRQLSVTRACVNVRDSGNTLFTQAPVTNAVATEEFLQVGRSGSSRVQEPTNTAASSVEVEDPRRALHKGRHY